MAQIPTLTRQRGLPRSTGVPAMQAVQIVDPVGKALGSVFGVMGEIGDQLHAEDLDRQLSSLKVKAIRDLGDLKLVLSKDPDFASHPAKFDLAVKGLEKRYKSEHPLAYKDFERFFGQYAARSSLNVRATANKRQIDRSRAELAVGLDELTRAYGTATSKLERLQISDTAEDLISGRVRTGVISAVDATSRLKSFTSGITETQVRQNLFVDPEATETALLQGKYPELTPEKRVVWLERATAKVEADRAQRVRLSDRAERDAGKVLKVTEAQTAKDGFELLAKDELTMDWVVQNEGKLSKSDYISLLDKLTDDDATEDNTDVVADLYGRVASEDVGAEAIEAYKRGDLKRETMGAILSRNDKFRGNQEPRDAYKRAAAYIQTSLGVNEMQNIPGQRRRLADAVLDFDAWVQQNPGATGKESIEASRRIVREYSIIDWNTMSINLRFPDWMAGSRFAPDIDASKQALVDNFMKKHSGDRAKITADPEFQRATRILRNWEGAVRMRDRSTGATQQ